MAGTRNTVPERPRQVGPGMLRSRPRRAGPSSCGSQSMNRQWPDFSASFRAPGQTVVFASGSVAGKRQASGVGACRVESPELRASASDALLRRVRPRGLARLAGAQAAPAPAVRRLLPVHGNPRDTASSLVFDEHGTESDATGPLPPHEIAPRLRPAFPDTLVRLAGDSGSPLRCLLLQRRPP